jgi:hypothetical protein
MMAMHTKPQAPEKKMDNSMEWAYDPRVRCWRLTLGAWEARVERWPASLEYTAQLIAAGPGRRVINAPHVFAQMEAAQAWCLRELADLETPGD